MNIAYIIPSLRQTGPIIVVKNLCQNLKNYGVNIDVFYFDPINEIELNVPTLRIKFNEPIDFDKYDIIHSHCFRSDRYVYQWRKHISKAKTITTLHQDTYESFKFEYNRFFAYFLTKYWIYIQSSFNGVISISNQLKNRYNTSLNNKVYTIYNGVNVEIKGKPDYSTNNRIKELKERGYKILGTYAFVVKRKGLNQIIEALPDLKDYAFVIIGNGPEVDNLKSLSIKKHVENRVLYIQHIDQPYKYLDYVDIYVMPSYSEGFGLAMVEAAFMKKAIVCSNIESFHEIFTNNEAVFFDLDNKESLINAIKNTFENINEYASCSYNKANAFFSDKVMAGNHLKYYKNIVNLN